MLGIISKEILKFGVCCVDIKVALENIGAYVHI